MTNDTATTTDQQFATTMADGLRAIANLIDGNPHLARKMQYSLRGINIPVADRDEMVAFVRGAKAAGATITKAAGEKYFSAICTWGPVGLDVFAAREEVCERVVIGTETVTTQVPDPALLAGVPLVEVTETVEQVEWKCRPLLADAVVEQDMAVAS